MEGHARRALLVLALIASVTATGRLPAAQARTGHTHPCIFDHVGLKTAPGTCRPHAQAYPRKVKSRVERAIYDGALTFGMPYATLLKIARCESGLNARAASAGHFGLYQFLPRTFQSGAARLRRDTGIVARSYWRPLDASYVAGYMFAVGEASNWQCVDWSSS